MVKNALLEPGVNDVSVDVQDTEAEDSGIIPQVIRTAPDSVRAEGPGVANVSVDADLWVQG